ncbi:MAG: hypothetical protein IPK69_04875 [Phycisphaerales bacterium]|nr:MAG: hypothetical protein IPK69_04875 [Phycisphaerales bacterium]
MTLSVHPVLAEATPLPGVLALEADVRGWVVMGILLIGLGVVVYAAWLARRALATQQSTRPTPTERDVESLAQAIAKLHEVAQVQAREIVSLKSTLARMERENAAASAIARATEMAASERDRHDDRRYDDRHDHRTPTGMAEIKPMPRADEQVGDLYGDRAQNRGERELQDRLAMSEPMRREQPPVATTPPIDPLHRTIHTLSDEGLSPAEIATRVERPVGQVELILALRRVLSPA